MTEYHKLVRDRIPEIIAAKGSTAVTHIADDAEYRAKLDSKLREEVEEFLEAHDPEELADLLEVLRAQAELTGGLDAVEVMRQKKFTERGGFSKRIILERS